MTVLRIALCGPSGAGKTTFARALLAECPGSGLVGRHLRIAKPLYALQRQVYALAGMEISTDEFQDAKLLSMLGRHVRDISRDALIDRFRSEVTAALNAIDAKAPTGVALVCSDARDPDLVDLREMGFVLVYVSAPQSLIRERIRSRGDKNAFQLDPTLEVAPNRWDWDTQIENSGSIADLEIIARDLVGRMTVCTP